MLNKFKINQKYLVTFIKYISTAVVGFSAYKYYENQTRHGASSCATKIAESSLPFVKQSIRTTDVEMIKHRMQLKPNELNNKFTVVVGPNGIGKTVAIQTAAKNLSGKIHRAL